MLGLSPGTPVYRFHRIRFADELADGARIFDHSRLTRCPMPAVVRGSLYEALNAAGNRPVRALQRLRAVLFDAQQAALLGVEPGAPGPADRAPRLPRGRPRRRDDPILVSRRRLRLRRRAERRSDDRAPAARSCSPKPARRPAAVAASARRQSRRRWRRSPHGCAAQPPRTVLTLRARQLGPCRHLRQISDRDPARHPDRVGGALGRFALRRAGADRGDAVPGDLAIGAEPRPAGRRRAAREGRRRDDPSLWSTHPTRRSRRSPIAVLPLHAGPERSVRGDQVLHRRPRGARRPGRSLGRRTRPWRRPWPTRRRDLPRRGRPTGRALVAGLTEARGLYVDRPRPRARHRPGGGAQAQGDLRPPRRGVQRRRAAARPDGPGRPRFPLARLPPVGRDRGQRRRSGPRRRAPRRAGSSSPARRRPARSRCRRSTAASGDRADAADPELLSRRGAPVGARAASIPTARRTWRKVTETV